MSGVNKVILVGRLGKDPEVKESRSGVVTNISVATSQKWKDKQTGEMQERTEWHRVVFFNRLAEIASEYLVKGSQVYIEGSLKTNKYEDKTGKTCYATSITARELEMLDSRGDNKNAAQSEKSIEAAAKKHRNVKSGMDSMESLHGDNVKDDADIPF